MLTLMQLGQTNATPESSSASLSERWFPASFVPVELISSSLNQVKSAPVGLNPGTAWTCLRVFEDNPAGRDGSPNVSPSASRVQVP